MSNVVAALNAFVILFLLAGGTLRADLSAIFLRFHVACAVLEYRFW